MTTRATGPTLSGRPSTRDTGLLVLGVAAVSASAPLVVAMAIPALAIAFWRNALAVVAIGAYVGTRRERRHELTGLSRRELRLSVTAGAFLAAHFATWIPSLRLTTVASSVALVCLQPVWIVIYARFRGEAIPGGTWLGVAVAFAGVLVLTGIDAGRGAEALLGDLLALIGGMVVAGYTLIGSQVRRTVSTSVYTLVCYSACAAVLALVCVTAGVPFGGYTAGDWGLLVLLTVLAQLLGHTVINVVLRSTSPTVVSLAILFEVPGSIVIAAALLNQVPPLQVLPAVALMLFGIALVVRVTADRTPVPDPPG